MVSLFGLKFSAPRRLTGCACEIFCLSFWAVSVIFANCASLMAIWFLSSCCYYLSKRRPFFLLRDRLLRSLLRLLEPRFALLSALPFLPLSSAMLISTFLSLIECTDEGILTLPIFPRDRGRSSNRVGVVMSFCFEEDFLRPAVAADPRLLLNVTVP